MGGWLGDQSLLFFTVSIFRRLRTAYMSAEDVDAPAFGSGCEQPSPAFDQCIDRSWQDMKKHIPSEIAAKDPKSKLINGNLWTWIYSWQWRRNCGGDLWAAMPALFHS